MHFIMNSCQVIWLLRWTAVYLPIPTIPVCLHLSVNCNGKQRFSSCRDEKSPAALRPNSLFLHGGYNWLRHRVVLSACQPIRSLAGRYDNPMPESTLYPPGQGLWITDEPRRHRFLLLSYSTFLYCYSYDVRKGEEEGMHWYDTYSLGGRAFFSGKDDIQTR
jgi:hypothetical protein